jgi:ribosomal protein S18 acetylase RimI-like enzyme
MRDLDLRNASAEDAAFLYDLHKVAMREYIEKTWGWDESFQKAYFDDHFDPSLRKLISWAGSVVGCISYRSQPDGIELDYIALLPEYQRRGIGTFLVRQIISEAETRGLPIRLRVLKVNPARSLYERLGYIVSGGDAQRYYMERSPACGPTSR